MESMLNDAARRAIRFLEGLDTRRAGVAAADVARLDELIRELPAEGIADDEVIDLLDEVGSPATVANAGGRYFGFVQGGTLPVTVAASWLATAWDQGAGAVATGPITARLEEVAIPWLLDVLDLPRVCAAGFVTGATMANFSGLAAARHAQLQKLGWDVERDGLFGAPELQVVVGDEVHVSVTKALTMLGLGRDRVTRVPVDGQGRMLATALPALDATTILCLQAGNVNTGSFDPAELIIPTAREAGAWVHVDGAFGLWAAAAPGRRHLVKGFNMADSWGTDAHKWLNVPYDSGLVFVRDAGALRAAMSFNAAYLAQGAARDPYHYVPEMSRRGRGVEIWAALLSLGREGIGVLVERCCQHATRFAQGLAEAGFEVLNEVDLNQVLVSFGDDQKTRRVIHGIQEEGTCWCGGTTWQGRSAMRISVSSWATTTRDVERSLEAIIRVARQTM